MAVSQQPAAAPGRGTFTELLKSGDLVSGQMKAYRAGGCDILVARVGERFLAADNRCPHMGGNLAAGGLQGTVVTCPWHGSQFDLEDGRVVRWTGWSGWKLGIARVLKPPRRLTVHATRVDAGAVLVEI